jgi:hypothetical protein
MSDTGPKSAYELAMERLRRKDEQEGTVRQPMSENARQAIAELRAQYEGRLAELEVMHKSAMAGPIDPGARYEMEMNYRRERQRLAEERDGKIDKIRSQGSSE